MQKLRRLYLWLNERNRAGDRRWQAFIWKCLFWSLGIAFVLGTLVFPLWEDFDNLAQRKACEAKHQVKCERQWAPVQQ